MLAHIAMICVLWLFCIAREILHSGDNHFALTVDPLCRLGEIVLDLGWDATAAILPSSINKTAFSIAGVVGEGYTLPPTHAMVMLSVADASTDKNPSSAKNRKHFCILVIKNFLS